jgi:predicted nucleotidyltransferase
MQIKNIGKFHQIDKNGFIQNSCILPIQQPDYKVAVDEILSLLTRNLDKLIHSIYIRGSVAKGTAVPFISDIDTLIITTRNLTEKEKEIQKSIYTKITSKYDYVNGIELFFINIDECKDIKIQFLLKTQCGCISGNNIIDSINNFKLDESAFMHSDSFSESMKNIKEELDNENDENEIVEICVWMMRRIIRTGYETVMIQDNSYTRDLYPNYVVFSNYYPEKKEAMYNALVLAIHPTSDKIKIISVAENLIEFIIEKIKLS